jgi:hypothetical protein
VDHQAGVVNLVVELDPFARDVTIFPSNLKQLFTSNTHPVTVKMLEDQEHFENDIADEDTPFIGKIIIPVNDYKNDDHQQFQSLNTDACQTDTKME